MGLFGTLRRKKDGKRSDIKRRIFLLFWDKKVVAVLIKSSVYAGFKVSWNIVYLHRHQVFL